MRMWNVKRQSSVVKRANVGRGRLFWHQKSQTLTCKFLKQQLIPFFVWLYCRITVKGDNGNLIRRDCIVDSEIHKHFGINDTIIFF